MRILILLGKCLGIDLLLYAPISVLLAIKERYEDIWFFARMGGFYEFEAIKLFCYLCIGLALFMMMRLMVTRPWDWVVVGVTIAVPAIILTLYTLVHFIQDWVFEIGARLLLYYPGTYNSIGAIVFGCLLAKAAFWLLDRRRTARDTQ